MKAIPLVLLALFLSPFSALASEGALTGKRIQCAGAGQTYLIAIGEELPGGNFLQHNYKAVVSGYRLLLETTAHAKPISTRTKFGFSVSLPLGHGRTLYVQNLEYSILKDEPAGVSGALLRDDTPSMPAMKLTCQFTDV
jgi:hypothetical protein